MGDWEKLDQNERHFIKRWLENLAPRFLVAVQEAEARTFYGFQIMIEVVFQNNEKGFDENLPTVLYWLIVVVKFQ